MSAKGSDGSTPKKAEKQAAAAERKARVAANMKANIARRKAQSRGRDAGAGTAEESHDNSV